MNFLKKHTINIFWVVVFGLLLYFLPNIYNSTRLVYIEKQLNNYHIDLQNQLKDSIELLENENSADLGAFYQEKELRLTTGKAKEGESILYLRGLPEDYDKSDIFPHDEVNLRLIDR